MGGLELLIALPLIGAVVVLGLGSAREEVGAWVAVAIASVTLVGSVFPWVATMRSDGDFVGTTDASWIEALDVRWSLGVDALSAPLVVLTALLAWCCLVALLRRAPDCGFRPRAGRAGAGDRGGEHRHLRRPRPDRCSSSSSSSC